MPRLWSETIATHRRGVHEAILHATARLVAREGLHALTMSQIAEEAGIGRATLYKYFPDVEAIVLAWHERQVSEHLAQLARTANDAADAGERLAAVLSAYANILRTRESGHAPELGALLHRGAHVQQARQQLGDFMINLLAEGAARGAVRSDVPPNELARYCLQALEAARSLPSDAAVQRLVAVTLDGLRGPR